MRSGSEGEKELLQWGIAVIPLFLPFSTAATRANLEGVDEEEKTERNENT